MVETLAPSLATAAQIAEFRRDGAAIVRNLIGAHWREAAEQAFGELIGEAHDLSDYYGDDRSSKIARPGKTLSRGENWLHSAAFRDLVFNSPLPQLAAEMIGSEEVRIYEDLLVFKGAGAQQPTPWHQDAPQNPLSGRQQCSIWFSLDRVTRATGALRFVNRSHRGPSYVPYAPDAQRELVEQDMRFFDGGPIPDIEADPARYDIKVWDLEPGDAIVFHPQVLHGAYGFAEDHPRRSFSIRFIGDDVRWEPKACVFHQWLREIDLQRGDLVRGARFPRLWPRAD